MRHLAGAFARLHFLEQKHERQAKKAENPEQPEVFHKSPEAALLQKLIVDTAHGLGLGLNRPGLRRERRCRRR